MHAAQRETAGATRQSRRLGHNATLAVDEDGCCQSCRVCSTSGRVSWPPLASGHGSGQLPDATINRVDRRHRFGKRRRSLIWSDMTRRSTSILMSASKGGLHSNII